MLSNHTVQRMEVFLWNRISELSVCLPVGLFFLLRLLLLRNVMKPRQTAVAACRNVPSGIVGCNSTRNVAAYIGLLFLCPL
jgi:hypothetical protein